MNRKIYTYEELDELTIRLFKHIKKDFKPDVVVGIARGGLVPAVILSHKFNVPLRTINVSLRDFESLESYNFSNEFDNILFIDDIADSGATFQQIAEPYKLNNTYDNVRSAALFVRHTNTFEIDYYGKHIEDDAWLVFPWEHDED